MAILNTGDTPQYIRMSGKQTVFFIFMVAAPKTFWGIQQCFVFRNPWVFFISRCQCIHLLIYVTLWRDRVIKPTTYIVFCISYSTYLSTSCFLLIVLSVESLYIGKNPRLVSSKQNNNKICHLVFIYLFVRYFMSVWQRNGILKVYTQISISIFFVLVIFL